MKKFVAAIASVLMVGAMLTSAMAAVPSVSVPSVSVPSVVVPSVGVKSPSVSSDITVKVIDSKTELVENEELTVRVTTLEEAVETDQFVADVYAAASGAESIDAYVKSLGLENVDLTDYKLSTMVKLEPNQALVAAANESSVVLTLEIPGVTAEMEVSAVVLEQVDGQTVAHAVEAENTADGVVVTTNVFGLLLIAVK